MGSIYPPRPSAVDHSDELVFISMEAACTDDPSDSIFNDSPQTTPTPFPSPVTSHPSYLIEVSDETENELFCSEVLDLD